MRLPKFLHRKLYEYAAGVMISRRCDQPLWRTEFKDGSKTLYMERWWAIPRNRWLNIYIHRFVASDEDGALHDHPWMNCSFLLRGGYYEWVPATKDTVIECNNLTNRMFHKGIEVARLNDSSMALARNEGDILLRLDPAKPHRIELDSETESQRIPGKLAGRREKPVTTLFITGPWMRTWGFHCPKGWVPWRKYVAEEGGKGCI